MTTLKFAFLHGLYDILLKFGQIPGLYFLNGWAQTLWGYLSKYRDKKERFLEIKSRVG